MNIKSNEEVEKFIENFYGQTLRLNLDPEESSDFRERISTVFTDGSDLEVFKNERYRFTFIGSVLKEIKKHSNDIVLVYKLEETIKNKCHEYYGFIYNDTSNESFVEYYVITTECFDERNRKTNPFHTNMVRGSSISFLHDHFKLYDNVKGCICEKAYNLFVDFMLEDSNNKVKNVIYKLF